MLTLNLLPPARKQQLKYLELGRRFRAIAILMTVTVLILIGLAEITNLHLQQEQAQVATDLATARIRSAKSEAGDISQTTLRLNQTIRAVADVLPVAPQWAVMTRRLLSVLPDSIFVSNLEIDAPGNFVIEGLADTRMSFTSLNQALKSAPELSNVTTTSTAAKRESIPFRYTGLITPTNP